MTIHFMKFLQNQNNLLFSVRKKDNLFRSFLQLSLCSSIDSDNDDQSDFGIASGPSPSSASTSKKMFDDSNDSDDLFGAPTILSTIKSTTTATNDTKPVSKPVEKEKKGMFDVSD